MNIYETKGVRSHQTYLSHTLCAIVLFMAVVTSAHAQITIENAVIRLGRYQTAVASDGSPSSITSPGWT